ncbi:MAG: SDR family oxidoreductase [Xanthobacteraceae bacterium]|nr:SDR family oxidoreductase [Xanthobacteraceae bacterium]
MVATSASLPAHPSLAGRAVIVTGGSRGLGRAMVLGLAQAGARVAIVARGDSAPLKETLARVAATGVQSNVICALGDLRNPPDCERMAAEVLAAFGRIDVLVNNAGVPNIGPGAPFWKVDIDDWQRMSRSNTDGVFFMTRAVAPIMIAQEFGKIVNVSTGAGTIVRKHFSPYGPSKAFLEAASRIWAQDLAGTGVTVNVLLPGGAVDTAADVTGVPAPGRSFQPASVMVPPILWLASDASNAHTGERFVASRWDESLPLAECIKAARDEGVDTPRIM